MRSWALSARLSLPLCLLAIAWQVGSSSVHPTPVGPGPALRRARLASEGAAAVTAPPDGDECCHAAGSLHANNASSLPRSMAFLIGAQKSGTTFLFHELVARHPRIKSHRVEICTPQKTKTSIPMKEPHFFDRIPLGSFDKYLQRFGHESDPDATYLDATPDYIHIPSAACRIASAFPKAKLVVMLKDPVMRALSGWNMVRHQGKLGVKTFTEEVQHELRVLRELKCSFELGPSQQAAGQAQQARNPAWTNSGSSGDAGAAPGHITRLSLLQDGQQALGSASSAGELRNGAAAKQQRRQQLPSEQGIVNTSVPSALAVDQQVVASPPAGHDNAGGNIAANSSSRVAASTDTLNITGMPAMANNLTTPANMTANSSGEFPVPTNSSDSAALASDLADTGIMTGSSASVKGAERWSWRRAQALPSWNSCFRCDFSYCNGYLGPVDGHICRQDRMGTLGNLRRGLYVYQLEHWLRYFPPEQLLVINYEQFVHDREAVLDTIIRFLGQDPLLKKGPEFNKKRGFYTPHTQHTFSTYAKVIDELYQYYAHPNAELYRLMEALGAGLGGWSGTFPATFQQHLQRQKVARRKLASMAAAEAAAVMQLRPSAAAQASLEQQAEQLQSAGHEQWHGHRRGPADAKAQGPARSLLAGVPSIDADETPWYKTMMASWQQHGCEA